MKTSRKYTKMEVIDILHKELDNMNFDENEKFATERELMDRFAVSRTTVRQIIDDLVSSGYLYRIKGRGAFVNKKIIHRNGYIRSFSDLMIERGMVPSSKVIEIKKIRAPELARLYLGLSDGSQCYFIKRIRFADKEAIAVETIYVSLDTVPGIEAHDLERESFYDLLENTYNRKFGYNKEMISAVEIDGEVSQALYGVDRSIALKIIDVLYDDNHKVLEYAESWYHAEKYTYLSISVQK